MVKQYLSPEFWPTTVVNDCTPSSLRHPQGPNPCRHDGLGIVKQIRVLIRFPSLHGHLTALTGPWLGSSDLQGPVDVARAYVDHVSQLNVDGGSKLRRGSAEY